MKTETIEKSRKTDIFYRMTMNEMIQYLQEYKIEYSYYADQDILHCDIGNGYYCVATGDFEGGILTLKEFKYQKDSHAY